MTVYRHTASGTFPGESWSCTFHTTGSVDLTAAQAAWVTAWTNFWSGVAPPADAIGPLIATDVTTDQLVTSALDPVTFHQVARAEDDPSLVGTADGASLPPQCAAGITWESAVASKKGRGRMYLPVFSTSTVAAGRLATADVTKVLAAAGNIPAAFTTAALTSVIFNRVSHDTTPITTIRVGDVFNTQRRRRDKLVPVYQSADL